MQINKKRTINLGKQNHHENVNKRDSQSLNKIDRLLMIKKITHEDKQTHQIKLLKNSKELRLHSKSYQEKNGHKLQLKPITEQPLNNTQQFCQLYAHNILEQSSLSQDSLGSFLMKHDIDKNLRARMLDWMIEVISSYKFNAKTYFSSVYIMDRYFQAEESRLPITKLHITGVICMLIATKMDEVFPLKIKTVYDKIVHKKIDKKDLVDTQARITTKLNFALNVWSFYDLALLKLHENSQFKNEDVLKELESICDYLGKFVVFNYELFGHYNIQILSQSLLKAAYKVYGVEKIKLLLGDKSMIDFQTNKDSLICMDLIFDTIKTFKTTFKNLNNIFKFSEANCIQRVDEYLKKY